MIRSRQTSSRGLPTLVLDLQGQRTQRWLAMMLSGVASLAPLTVVSGIAGVIASMVAALSLLSGFRWAGWLGGNASLRQVVWRSDGPWILGFAAGDEREAHLCDSSRMSPFAIWLRWKIDPVAGQRAMRTRTLLLLPWDVYQPDFRRLLVRLRLDQSECAPTAAQANS